MFGLTTVAFLMKMIPYVIGIRVIGGIVDISVHAVKTKIK